MADDGNNEDMIGLSPDERIIAEAKKRFKRCNDWEAQSQTRFVADMKFANGDPDNGWQWPNYLWTQRQDDPNGYKPRLTINKTRQHNLLIKNDNKQNKPSIKISPVGSDATFKAAQAWMGIIRHIERTSKATMAYDLASSFQVDGGIGYIRVVTDYIDDDSFDQDIYIKGVKNPLNCYLDPDHQELDGSDSNFGFAFEDVPRDEFLHQYPKMRDKMGNTAVFNDVGQDGWWSESRIRVAEYFTRTMKRDRLVLMRNPEDDKEVIARWSKIPKEVRDQIDDDTIIREREILEHQIKWYKIACDTIIEKPKIWPGRFIPIVPVVGEEVVIDGELDRKGHTRNLKDAQRMYNFWSSSAVEQVALQTKTKWFIPVGSTDNLETYWRAINTNNYPFIPYNAVTEDGNPLPPPTPIEPPTMAEGFIKGMMVAQSEMMMASGQYQSQMGEQGNEVSGKAINARQRQGDTATYHFIDNLATAIRQVGNIILDIAPHIYDTKQIRQILAEDGTINLLEIDPEAQTAYSEQKREIDGQAAVIAILNPRIGRYWVDADVGPNYATRRQEAWNAFVQITTANRELVTTIGDLMFKNADFPGADIIAERLKRLVPPNVLGEGPTPELQQAQALNQNLQKLYAEALDELAKKNLELKDRSEKNAIERERADSDRIKQLDNAGNTISAEELRPLIEQTLQEMLAKMPLTPGTVSGGEPDGDEGGAGGRTGPAGGAAGAGSASPGPGGATGGEAPPVPGAQLAPDGNYYVQHPEGDYSQVVPNG